jgi:hypothetical protein
LSVDLLLLTLLKLLIAPSHSAGQPAHRRSGGGAFACVSRYCAAYHSKRGAARRASYDMPLRRRRLIRRGPRVRGGR